MREYQQFETMSRSRAVVYYEGKVQGVGFRYSTKNLATGFEVSGTVRNLTDGRVELILEGEKDEISAFHKALRESELGHFIKKEDIMWQAALDDLRGFAIIR